MFWIGSSCLTTHDMCSSKYLLVTHKFYQFYLRLNNFYIKVHLSRKYLTTTAKNVSFNVFLKKSVLSSKFAVGVCLNVGLFMERLCRQQAYLETDIHSVLCAFGERLSYHQPTSPYSFTDHFDVVDSPVRDEHWSTPRVVIGYEILGGPMGTHSSLEDSQRGIRVGINSPSSSI